MVSSSSRAALSTFVDQFNADAPVQRLPVADVASQHELGWLHLLLVGVVSTSSAAVVGPGDGVAVGVPARCRGSNRSRRPWRRTARRAMSMLADLSPSMNWPGMWVCGSGRGRPGLHGAVDLDDYWSTVARTGRDHPGLGIGGGHIRDLGGLKADSLSGPRGVRRAANAGGWSYWTGSGYCRGRPLGSVVRGAARLPARSSGPRGIVVRQPGARLIRGGGVRRRRRRPGWPGRRRQQQVEPDLEAPALYSSIWLRMGSSGRLQRSRRSTRRVGIRVLVAHQQSRRSRRRSLR